MRMGCFSLFMRSVTANTWLNLVLSQRIGSAFFYFLALTSGGVLCLCRCNLQFPLEDAVRRKEKLYTHIPTGISIPVDFIEETKDYVSMSTNVKPAVEFFFSVFQATFLRGLIFGEKSLKSTFRVKNLI